MDLTVVGEHSLPSLPSYFILNLLKEVVIVILVLFQDFQVTLAISVKPLIIVVV